MSNAIKLKTPFNQALLYFGTLLIIGSSAFAIEFVPSTFTLIPPIRNGSSDKVAVGNFFCRAGLGCKNDGVIVFKSNTDGNSKQKTAEREIMLRVSSNPGGGLEDVSFNSLYGGQSANLGSPLTGLESGLTIGGCVGDLNGDGYSDIVAVNTNYRHKMWINSGAAQPGTMRDRTADLNEQHWSVSGNRVVNASNITGNDLYQYVADGNINNTTARDCAIGDLNGDGFNDIIIVHSSVITTKMIGQHPLDVAPATTIQVFLNQGAAARGVFRDVTRTREWIIPANRADPILSKNFKVYLRDWNGDNHPDIVILGAADGSANGHNFILIYDPVNHSYPAPSDLNRVDTAANGGPFFARSFEQVAIGNVKYALYGGIDGVLRAFAYQPGAGGAAGTFLSVPLGTVFDPSTIPDVTPNAITAIKTYLGPATNPSKATRLLAIARTDRIELYGVKGKFLRYDSTSGDAASGSIYDIANLDVNRDGGDDLVLSGSSTMRVATIGPDFHYHLASAYLNARTMNSQSVSKCMGPVNPDQSCPATGSAAYLMPGYLNFNPLFQSKRNLKDTYYGMKTGGFTPGFEDLSAYLNPQPKMANYEACMADAAARGIREPSPLSDFMANCDHPEACQAALHLQCTDAQIAAKTGVGGGAGFLSSCSWNTFKAASMLVACNAQCMEDCDKVNDQSADLNLLGILGRTPLYCAQDQTVCKTQCSIAFENGGGTPPHNDAYDRLLGRVNSSSGSVKVEQALIEQTGSMTGIDFDGDGRTDLVSEATYQGTTLYRNIGPDPAAPGPDRFAAVDPSHLPCPLSNNPMENGSVIAIDFNHDGRMDLIHIRKEQPVELWLNQLAPGANLAAPGKWFLAYNLRPNDPQIAPKAYATKIVERDGKPPVFFVSDVQTRTDNSGADFTIEKWIPGGVNGSGLNRGRPVNYLRPQAIANDASSLGALLLKDGVTRAGLACLDHTNGTLTNPCPRNISLVKLGDTNFIHGSVSAIEVADIDGDGNLDLILGPTGWREIVENFLPGGGSDDAHFTSPRMTLLLSDSADIATARFEDASRHVQYNMLDAPRLSFTVSGGALPEGNGTGINYTSDVQFVTGISAADFDGDGDIDLLITDFSGPVYLQNEGRDCWLAAATQPDKRCLTPILTAFGSGMTGFNGITGLKNYGSTVFDVNRDGLLDFVMRAAGEDIVYLQRR